MPNIQSVSYSSRGVQVVVKDQYIHGAQINYQNQPILLQGRPLIVSRHILPPVTRPVEIVDIRVNRWGLVGETQYSWEWSDVCPE